MPTYQYDYIVFIGRFQPFHNGHKYALDRALTLAERVIVFVGSAFQPRTIKNPFTAEERIEMLHSVYPDNKQLISLPIRDQLYNDQRWIAEIQEKTRTVIAAAGWRPGPTKIGITGFSKDESSYYLDLFPQWESVPHEPIDMINATDIRRLLFEGISASFVKSTMPEVVFDYVSKFKNSDDFKQLRREYDFIKQYKAAWSVAPYAPTFLTVDAGVIQSGHILLVQRKASPGEGLWALPGGFVNQNETIVDAMVRELREETKLKVPAPVLKGSIKAMKVFDHPDRSLRGRTITHAHLIELPAGPLPAVKGGDDAKKAKWFPISEIRSENLFEDHYDIIQYFLGQV